MRRPLRRTVGVLVCPALGFSVSAVGSTALADEVPNAANWHIHDGMGAGPLADDHHAPLGFWRRLFAQEGLVYGTAEAPVVRCPNATDKAFLPNGVNGAVEAAGVCMSDRFIVHLPSGVDTRNGWSTLTFRNGIFLSYRLGPRLP